MAAGWHSLPELNRAFAVGETAFLTARRREHDSRNKTANPVFPTILKPVDQMIYGFCFLSCSLVVVRKIGGVEAGHAWKDEKHPCCGGAAEPAAS